MTATLFRVPPPGVAGESTIEQPRKSPGRLSTLKNKRDLVGATGFEAPAEGRENRPIPAKTVESARTNSPAEGIREDSTGPGADHARNLTSIARAIELAAQQGEWAIVASLTRQLDLLAAQQGANDLRVLRGGRR